MTLRTLRNSYKPFRQIVEQGVSYGFYELIDGYENDYIVTMIKNAVPNPIRYKYVSYEDYEDFNKQFSTESKRNLLPNFFPAIFKFESSADYMLLYEESEIITTSKITTDILYYMQHIYTVTHNGLKYLSYKAISESESDVLVKAELVDGDIKPLAFTFLSLDTIRKTDIETILSVVSFQRFKN